MENVQYDTFKAQPWNPQFPSTCSGNSIYCTACCHFKVLLSLVSCYLFINQRVWGRQKSYTIQQNPTTVFCYQTYFLLDYRSVICLPNKEAEEAEECVHEADIVGDAGDDCLLAVRTHSLHRWGLEHFPLQHSHSGGCSWRSQDGRCVTSHVDKVAWTGTHLSWHWVRKVTRRRWVGTTCTEGYDT